jgi:hypothetical protein
LGLGLALFPWRHFPVSRDRRETKIHNFHGGLGGIMLKQGIDIRNRANWPKMVDWNLDYLAKHKSWHDWSTMRQLGSRGLQGAHPGVTPSGAGGMGKAMRGALSDIRSTPHIDDDQHIDDAIRKARHLRDLLQSMQPPGFSRHAARHRGAQLTGDDGAHHHLSDQYLSSRAQGA